MKKFLLKILIFLVIIISPFAIFITVTECLPNQYDKTYVAELPDKIARLNSINDKKILFVGGSSLPFGIDSAKIEDELDGEYKVVNFGLYATLGTKLMMDLSKSNINKGDIVILTPELNEQTYSLYFNPAAVLEALDGFSLETRYLSAEDNLKLFYNYYKFAFSKIKYYSKNSAPDPIGIYRHDSFNEYGDICVDRKNNIMVNGVDSNTSVYTDDRLLNQDFIDYVNNYVKFVTSRGANVYFNFCPTNILALKSSKMQREIFQAQLAEKLDCKVLCNIENCILDEGYFYDTNFHLNSTGAEYYTNIVVNDIKRVLNKGSGGAIIIPSLPESGPQPDLEPLPTDHDKNVDFDEYDGGENVDYLDAFEYRLVGTGYQIERVRDEYKNMTEVIVPTQYNGKAINTLASNCFNGCTELKKIHIGKSIRSIVGTPFNGCIGLIGIYMYELDGNKINPPSSGLMDGANRNAKIFIPQGANYTSGYTWESYRDILEYYSK